MAAIGRRTSPWLWLSALALGVSLTHVFIDWHIGLFGASSMHMSALQAGLVLSFGLVAAWWALALALASQGHKSALVSLLVLDLGFTLLANSVAVLAACPLLVPARSIIRTSATSRILSSGRGPLTRPGRGCELVPNRSGGSCQQLPSRCWLWYSVFRLCRQCPESLMPQGTVTARCLLVALGDHVHHTRGVIEWQYLIF